MNRFLVNFFLSESGRLYENVLLEDPHIYPRKHLSSLLFNHRLPWILIFKKLLMDTEQGHREDIPSISVSFYRLIPSRALTALSSILIYPEADIE